MIVELIGCTGAGKSTLAERLCRGGIGATPVTRMHDLAVRGPLRDRISSPTVVNLVQEAASLPFLAVAARRQAPFLAYAARTLVRTAPSPLHRANRLRGVARRVGMFELASRTARGRIVLSDEGTALLAYMLVLDGHRPSDAEVGRLAELVPVPDLVVHVTAPVDVLLRRSRERSDRDRQLGGKTEAGLEALIERTVDVFERLVAHPAIAARTVTFSSRDSGADDAGVEKIKFRRFE